MENLENSVSLFTIHREIKEKNPPEIFAQYFQILRQWMNGRITLEAFDKQAQRLIPLDLHTKSLISIINLFEVDFLKKIYFLFLVE